MGALYRVESRTKFHLMRRVVSVGIVLASADFLEGSRNSAFYLILAIGLQLEPSL
jgi:hypothetical protein